MTTEELPRPWLRQYDADTPHEIPLFDAPLYSLLDRAADQYPRRQALIFQNTRITYAALRERAERFAGALRRAGIAPGERVAVMLPNLPQTAEAFWGILKAGAIAVMVNPLYMETELCTNLNDAEVETLIVLDALWPRIAPLRSRLPVRRYIITTVDEELALQVAAYIEEKRAVGAEVTVVSAEGVDIRIAATVQLTEGAQIAAVQQEFQTAVQDYIAQTVFDNPFLSYNRLAFLLMGVPGVRDYTALTLNGGQDNIDLPLGQVPVLQSVEVSAGAG